MSATVKSTRKATTFSLAAMQEITEVSNEVQSLLVRFEAPKVKHRARVAVALESASVGMLSTATVKRINAKQNEGIAVERAARFELPNDHYAAPTFKGAVYVYARVRDENGKHVSSTKVARFASEAETLKAYGN